MTNYRKYLRDLTDNTLNDLKIHYAFHLKNKGFLTPKKKKRLLRIGKKEHGTSDSDFWYRTKHLAKHSILDLQLIANVADESQLKDIFEPLKKEDWQERDNGLYKRTDIRLLVESIFSSHKPEKSNRDDWRYKIALDMVTIGIGYFRNMPIFQSKLHNRAFDDVIDILDEHRDSTKSGFNY